MPEKKGAGRKIQRGEGVNYENTHILGGGFLWWPKEGGGKKGGCYDST